MCQEYNSEILLPPTAKYTILGVKNIFQCFLIYAKTFFYILWNILDSSSTTVSSCALGPSTVSSHHLWLVTFQGLTLNNENMCSDDRNAEVLQASRSRSPPPQREHLQLDHIRNVPPPILLVLLRVLDKQAS